jgi:hypothetical protein
MMSITGARINKTFTFPREPGGRRARLIVANIAKLPELLSRRKNGEVR